MILTRQPQGPARINWSHPLARGLRFYAPLNAAGLIDVVSGSFGTKTGLTDKEVVGQDLLPKFSSSNYVDFPSPVGINGSTPITIAWSQKLTGAGDSAVLTWTPTGASAQFTIYEYNASNYFLSGGATGSSSWSFNDAGTLVANRVEHYVVILPNGTDGSGSLAKAYRNGIDLGTPAGTSLGFTASSNVRIGAFGNAGSPFVGGLGNLHIWARALSSAEALQWTRLGEQYQVVAPSRRVWVQLGPAAGGATTDAAIAGTQATDVGAIAVQATTGAALAGTQASDVGAIAVAATTGCAIAGTQTTDVAAVNVTASTGTGTDADIAGTQATDVGAIAVSATLGLSIAGTQASDLGYIVVAATVVASMAGTQASDVAAIVVAGSSIWTDVGVSAATWSDVGGASSIWTDL
jgi:hypothetical protein